MTMYGVNFVISNAFASLFTINGGLLGITLGLLSYVLTALGLYTIAQRRGLRKPWLSWIPVLNMWILGSLSDQYRYVVHGQNKSKRKYLLILSLLTDALYTAAVCLALAGMGYAVYGVSARIVYRFLGYLVALCVPLCIAAIARAVIYFMALYDVYVSCEPKNSTMYLVLSIFFSIVKPFFLFFSREKDGGMPPRRDSSPPPAGASDSWEQEN